MIQLVATGNTILPLCPEDASEAVNAPLLLLFSSANSVSLSGLA